MCGIFGWHISKGAQISRDQRIILATVLGIRNDTRGGDSWGGVLGKDLKVLHGLGDVVNGIREFIPYARVMGHTRKATTGKVSLENSHPFIVGNIIGGHNGMVYNHSDLNKKYERDCSVDSMHIFKHIDEEKDFSEIQGYGAIEYIDIRNPDRVYLSKISSGGELSIFCMEQEIEKGKEKERVASFWSSNSSHAIAALRAACIPFISIEVKTGEVYFIEDGRVYVSTEKKHEVGSSQRSYSSGNSYHYCGGRGSYYSGDDFRGSSYYSPTKSEYDAKKLLESLADDSDFDCFGKLAAFGEQDDVCKRCPQFDKCKAAILVKAAGSSEKKEDDKATPLDMSKLSNEELELVMRGEKVEDKKENTAPLPRSVISSPHVCAKCGGFDFLDASWEGFDNMRFCECADVDTEATGPIVPVNAEATH